MSSIVNSPIIGSTTCPCGDCRRILSCLLSAAQGGVLVQDLTSDVGASPPIKLWMFMLLTTCSFLPSWGLVGLQGTAQHIDFASGKMKNRKGWKWNILGWNFFGCFFLRNFPTMLMCTWKFSILICNVRKEKKCIESFSLLLRII